MSKRVPVPVLLAAALMVGGAFASQALKPTVHLADTKPKLVLVNLFPSAFGDWHELKEVTPVLPDPTVQAMLDSLYSQTLARTYVNGNGQYVMMTIAYGSDQNSEATAAHRPEFCYVSNGFKVQDVGTHVVQLPSHQLTVRHLVSKRGEYVEPISYWVTLDESAALPGISRKLAQIRYGLKGEIADGMLVRISSPSRDQEAAFALHDQFVRDLQKVMPAGVRPRVFGS
ncbi:MAG: EpsI family protein [Burkholderiales bacterium]|nr:EpsI family protein [Burkholderiales bacterium]